MGDIKVFEGTDPLLTIRVKKKLPGGGTVPYTLDGVDEIEFFVKDDPDDLDSVARFKYTKTAGEIIITDDGAGPADTYGEMTIQCESDDLTPPGSYYFHLDVTKSSLRDTVKSGYFIVENI
jgi:hypothetical protein